jgi:hypothetical protein
VGLEVSRDSVKVIIEEGVCRMPSETLDKLILSATAYWGKRGERATSKRGEMGQPPREGQPLEEGRAALHQGVW